MQMCNEMKKNLSHSVFLPQSDVRLTLGSQRCSPYNNGHISLRSSNEVHAYTHGPLPLHNTVHSILKADIHMIVVVNRDGRIPNVDADSLLGNIQSYGESLHAFIDVIIHDFKLGTLHLGFWLVRQ